MLNRVFYDDVVQELPISGSGVVDSIFWRLSIDGSYTVKSSHNCANKENLHWASMASNSRGGSTFWSRLWKLDIQPKIKHRVWGAADGTLPSLSALAKKKIPVDSSCVFCKCEEGNLLHILKLCPQVKQVWKVLGLGVKVYKLGGSNCLHRFQDVFDVLQKDDQRTFCISVWWLWWEHNQITHGKQGTPVSRVVELILEQAKRKNKQAKMGLTKASLKSEFLWKPPAGDFVKMNVDAAVPEDCRPCTAGFIIRDRVGAVLMSGCSPLGGCLSVLHGELVSIFTGLEFAIQASFRKIIVASDSPSAVNACNGLVFFADYNGTVVEDIIRLAAEFEEIKFLFERGQANECGHSLAKCGASHNSTVILIKDAPAFVFPCIVKDLAVLA